MSTAVFPEPLIDASALDDLWWFVRIYTRGFEGADPLIGDLLPPVIAEARAQGISRWFYIRYMDEHGPHVRLRVLGPRAVLDQLQRVHAEIEAQLAEVLAEHPTEHRFIAPVPKKAWEGQLGTGVRAAIYEPELAKYGGPVGLALAEELFEFSSDLGVWACGRFAKESDRAGLAALLLHDVADSLMHGHHAAAARQRVSWDGYWERHLYWWTAELGHRGPAFRDRMVTAVQERADRVAESLHRVTVLPGVQSWRRRWSVALDTYLARAELSGVDRTPQHLAFHQGHMMLNRLGFLPREEAVLGVHARAWSSSR